MSETKRVMLTVQVIADVDEDADLDSLTLEYDAIYANIRSGRKSVGKPIGHETVSVESIGDEGVPGEDPPSCECDNTHDQNDTVCRWCWAKGRRKPSDPEVEESP